MTPGQLAVTMGPPAGGSPEADSADTSLSPDPAVLPARTPAGSPDAWALVAAAQRGDREAFGQLYARYVGAVSRVVGSRVGGDRPLTQDLTSETFLRALRRIDSVSYQGRDVGAWFTTIARNLVLDHVKSSRYRLERTTADIRDSNTDQDSPEQAVIRRETATEVRRCVAALPPDQQECIQLRFMQELSVAETAAVMGRNEGAVKALTHRGVGQLRAALANGNTAPVAPAREETADPLARARQAVGEVRQRLSDEDQHAAEQGRAQQLARWHSDDQASACQQRAGDRAGGLALTADGGAA